MTPEVFTEWLRRNGHKVVQSQSSYWFDQGPRAFQAFPHHWIIHPSDIETRELLKKHNAVTLRYSTSVSAGQGAISYHVVCDRPDYSLESLGKWARKNIRRGLKNCRVEKIPIEYLADEGWALRHDTLDRQCRRLNTDRDRWRQLCLSTVDLPGFEAWGALVGDRLAACMMTFPMGECCYLMYQHCHRDFLPEHVNNALTYFITTTMMSRPGIKYIFYGLHSLDAPQRVDEYKFRMGYTATPVRQRVVFHPLLKPVVNRFSHSILRKLPPKLMEIRVLAKAEGLFRFYLDGNLNLDKQVWPECLEGGKEALIRGANFQHAAEAR